MELKRGSIGNGESFNLNKEEQKKEERKQALTLLRSWLRWGLGILYIISTTIDFLTRKTLSIGNFADTFAANAIIFIVFYGLVNLLFLRIFANVGLKMALWIKYTFKK